MCNLLWSALDATIKLLSISPRCAGYFFGGDIVKSFCELNKDNFIAIPIVYQLIMEGYKFIFGEKLATIWSAPNYFYRYGNSTAIFQLD